jgi:hypothetical protein
MTDRSQEPRRWGIVGRHRRRGQGNRPSNGASPDVRSGAGQSGASPGGSDDDPEGEPWRDFGIDGAYGLVEPGSRQT